MLIEAQSGMYLECIHIMYINAPIYFVKPGVVGEWHYTIKEADIHSLTFSTIFTSTALIGGCFLISHRISLDGCLGVGIKHEFRASNECTAPSDSGLYHYRQVVHNY